jgi:hypothetical protein
MAFLFLAVLLFFARGTKSTLLAVLLEFITCGILEQHHQPS